MTPFSFHFPQWEKAWRHHLSRQSWPIKGNFKVSSACLLVFLENTRADAEKCWDLFWADPVVPDIWGMPQIWARRAADFFCTEALLWFDDGVWWGFRQTLTLGCWMPLLCDRTSCSLQRFWWWDYTEADFVNKITCTHTSKLRNKTSWLLQVRAAVTMF